MIWLRGREDLASYRAILAREPGDPARGLVVGLTLVHLPGQKVSWRLSGALDSVGLLQQSWRP